MNTSGEICRQHPEADFNNLKGSLAQDREASLASCWYKSDAETAKMWARYGRDEDTREDGVAVGQPAAGALHVRHLAVIGRQGAEIASEATLRQSSLNADTDLPQATSTWGCLGATRTRRSRGGYDSCLKS